jgi:Co/Zn/Cd efflux system component
MDCPSEEQIIRIKLDGLTNIQSMEFDIPNRLLCVFHYGENTEIFKCLATLNFGAEILSSVSADNFQPEKTVNSERKILWLVLIINFAFFLIEDLTGWIFNSMGLVADGLDMLADSVVYGLALMVVGTTANRKRAIAGWAGYLQLLLAAAGLVEVIKRFTGAEQMPDFRMMIVVSTAALTANSVCLYLLMKNKNREAHIRATMIFTSSDIIINTGVIIAGILVNLLHSNFPDLIVGSIVFIVITMGAFKILRLQ